MSFFNTLGSVLKGAGPAKFVLNLTNTLTLTSDPDFNQAANLSRIIVMYKSATGGQTKALTFRIPTGYDGTQEIAAYFKASAKAKDEFNIVSITFFDLDGAKLMFKGSDLGDVSSMKVNPAVPVTLMTFVAPLIGDLVITAADGTSTRLAAAARPDQNGGGANVLGGSVTLEMPTGSTYKLGYESHGLANGYNGLAGLRPQDAAFIQDGGDMNLYQTGDLTVPSAAATVETPLDRKLVVFSHPNNGHLGWSTGQSVVYSTSERFPTAFAATAGKIYNVFYRNYEDDQAATLEPVEENTILVTDGTSSYAVGSGLTRILNDAGYGDWETGNRTLPSDQSLITADIMYTASASAQEVATVIE